MSTLRGEIPDIRPDYPHIDPYALPMRRPTPPRRPSLPGAVAVLVGILTLASIGAGPASATARATGPGTEGPTAASRPESSRQDPPMFDRLATDLPVVASTPAATPAPTPITLAFAGDVHFADQVSALLSRPDTALESLKPHLATADLAMVNLETAITTRGTPAPKPYRFRASPAALTTLSAAGVDVASLANNHAVDYGLVGLSDTLAAREASPIALVGIGRDATEAYAPWTTMVREQRVSVLAASSIEEWTLATWSATDQRPGIASTRNGDRLIDAVRTARTHSDLVIVYLHWGIEGQTCPDAGQERLARALSAAGADIVIGTHAHRVQGAGWLGPTFVAYGLGNFVWYNHSSAGSSTTGVLTLTVRGRTVERAAWTPLRIAPDGVPRVQSSSATASAAAAWQRARVCTGLTDSAG